MANRKTYVHGHPSLEYEPKRHKRFPNDTTKQTEANAKTHNSRRKLNKTNQAFQCLRAIHAPDATAATPRPTSAGLAASVSTKPETGRDAAAARFVARFESRVRFGVRSANH
jgi:hypothetical protein